MYKDEEHFPLSFYTTQKAIAIYSTVQKQKKEELPDTQDQIADIKKSLKEKNISTYFKALGGKYIRNDMCITGDTYDCKGGQNISISGAHKLLKLSKKKELPMNNILETFKKSAPVLYKKFESNIERGKYSLSKENIMNRDYYNYRGGNDDIELIKLREEINQIRYSN